MNRMAIPCLVMPALAATVGLACPPGTVGVPDLNFSVVTWGVGSGQTATLLVVPDGSGPPLASARTTGGLAVDATITLVLIDQCGDPIVGYPREDMWLESQDGGLMLCNGGGAADQDTDANGQTRWMQPLRAGGHSAAPCRVVVVGFLIDELPLHFVSPDLNGDRVVSLMDVAQFATAYFGAYSFAADLKADGVVNLSDIAVLAGATGADCP